MNDQTIAEALEQKAPSYSAALAESVVPPQPGFYSIFIDDPINLPEPYAGHLREKQTTMLYIGIAGRSLLKRLIKQDLRHEGRSTFFRAIGAILGHRPLPGSLAGMKNQNNYTFSAGATRSIISWINDHLSVRFVQAATARHPNAEKFTIRRNCPILNTTHNPQSISALAELRKVCRTGAR